MSYAEAFDDLCTAVNAFEVNNRSNPLDIAFKNALIEALNSSEKNALDTLRDGELVIYGANGSETKISPEKDTGDKRTTEENEEFFRVAYGSISCTPAFESAIIREFFKKAGYSY